MVEALVTWAYQAIQHLAPKYLLQCSGHLLAVLVPQADADFSAPEGYTFYSLYSCSKPDQTVFRQKIDIFIAQQTLSFRLIHRHTIIHRCQGLHFELTSMQCYICCACCACFSADLNHGFCPVHHSCRCTQRSPFQSC